MSDGSGSRPRGRTIAAVVVLLVIAVGAVVTVLLVGNDDGSRPATSSADGALQKLVTALRKHDAKALRGAVCTNATGNAVLLRTKADAVVASVSSATITRAATERGTSASGAITVTTTARGADEKQDSVISLSKVRGTWCVHDVVGTSASGPGSGGAASPSATGSVATSRLPSAAAAFDALVTGLNGHDVARVSGASCSGSRLADNVAVAVRAIKAVTVLATPKAVAGGATGRIHVLGYQAGQSEDETVTLQDSGSGWCVQDVGSS